ncbi:Hypothetical predicted protein [Lecanosticta acicola]|uniref:DNA2/NAM7 helicase-like C-terminal domain-containing protein n=1 Tax=Lecanosticta acicola TaxID=111012 RepID=A0AAI8YZL3_9PEZI|nr:Hypothetical predicted protein [Lecanosticta acicola]
MAVPVQELLAYREQLIDGVTEGPITESTKLVALHQPNLCTDNGKLVRNLTQIARLDTENECFIITEDDVVLPPQAIGKHAMPQQYTFTASFNRLLTAPVLRLECKWPRVSAPHGQSGPFKVSLEFHFNSCDGVPGIENFEVRKNVDLAGIEKDEIVFTAHGATSQGLRNISKLPPHNRMVLGELVPVLNSFLKPETPIQVRLRFNEHLDRKDAAMASMLPYVLGDGVEKLPTMTLPEWSTLLPLSPERNIHALMDASAPHPMVPFECVDTYTSIDQASIELYESARLANIEQEESLRLWAETEHHALLYQVGRTVVMAVNFRAYRQLVGPGGPVKSSVPDRLLASATWTDPISYQTFTAEVSRCSLPVHLPSHDALFSIPKADGAIRATCLRSDPNPPGAQFLARVKFAPRMPKFTVSSQLNTVSNLRSADAAPWHPLILNQNHALEQVDLVLKRAEDVETPLEAEVEEAYQWMLNFRKWNAEQLQALKSIRKAVGGIVLITGPAGTGKTLVLQAICIFLYRLGLHILVLAPANSNCADFMAKLAQYFPEICGTRVLPSSMDSDIRKVSPSCKDDAEESDLADFEMMRADSQPSSEIPHHGLPAQVLQAARQGKHHDKVHQKIFGKNMDVWQELQKCVLKCDDGTFDWQNAEDVKVYQLSYNFCKAHFVAMSRLIITTTGNVRTADIVENWALGKHGIECKGIVVILDEACKDREIDTLSALLWPVYRNKITGMVMLGDERQLEPTNTCAKGKTVYNPFSDRLNVPFLTRLKREGFPCTELVEQHRMSEHIAQWPTANFYPAGMRNGPGTSQLLSEKQPGLHAVLVNILQSVGTNIPARFSAVQQDKFIRAHYLEVHGVRDNSKQSAFVREHIKFFFDKCYWPLRAYYGAETFEKVMIICAYKEARKCWHEAAQHLQHKYKIPNAQLPRILTIDSSQGCEAPVTFIDCSVQQYSARTKFRDIGFVDNDKRMNVAMTRAQDVRWILGGSCSVRERRRTRDPGTPAYVRHRDEIAEFTIVKNEKIKDAGTAWLEGLTKQDICLGRRFGHESTRPSH